MLVSAAVRYTSPFHSVFSPFLYPPQASLAAPRRAAPRALSRRESARVCALFLHIRSLMTHWWLFSGAQALSGSGGGSSGRRSAVAYATMFAALGAAAAAAISMMRRGSGGGGRGAGVGEADGRHAAGEDPTGESCHSRDRGRQVDGARSGSYSAAFVLRARAPGNEGAGTAGGPHGSAPEAAGAAPARDGVQGSVAEGSEDKGRDVHGPAQKRLRACDGSPLVSHHARPDAEGASAGATLAAGSGGVDAASDGRDPARARLGGALAEDSNGPTGTSKTSDDSDDSWGPCTSDDDEYDDYDSESESETALDSDDDEGDDPRTLPTDVPFGGASAHAPPPGRSQSPADANDMPMLVSSSNESGDNSGSEDGSEGPPSLRSDSGSDGGGLASDADDRLNRYTKSSDVGKGSLPGLETDSSDDSDDDVPHLCSDTSVDDSEDEDEDGLPSLCFDDSDSSEDGTPRGPARAGRRLFNSCARGGTARRRNSAPPLTSPWVDACAQVAAGDVKPSTVAQVTKDAREAVSKIMQENSQPRRARYRRRAQQAAEASTAARPARKSLQVPEDVLQNETLLASILEGLEGVTPDSRQVRSALADINGRAWMSSRTRHRTTSTSP